MHDVAHDRTKPALSYQDAGVDTEGAQSALTGLLGHVSKTLAFRQQIGSVVLPIGFFANVLDFGSGMGLAISTDGVGTKILIAQMMDKYDTIGIDCVAMNVNDVLCVGAEPLSLVDYIAVQQPNQYLLEEIAKGLARGCESAQITISGGEIAQLGEMVHGLKDGYGFDLVGTCVGRVDLDKIIVGRSITDGDIIVGLASTGIHSNGLSLARKVLFDQADLVPYQYHGELGRTIGEELLEPTHIYVQEIMEMIAAGVQVKGLANITSDGLLNLTRLDGNIEYHIDSLPEPQPIFRLIQRLGDVPDSEMFRVFNMGIGFCVVTAPSDVKTVEAIAAKHGVATHVLGRTVSGRERKVVIREKQLQGSGHTFWPL